MKSGVMFILAAGMSLLGACSSKSGATLITPMTVDEIRAHKAVAKKEPSALFLQPVGKVQEAGVHTLRAVGCSILEKQPYFLKGQRQMNLGRGGGEIIEIYLVPRSDNETDAWVRTKQTSGGWVFQHSWDYTVIHNMKTMLK